MAKVQAQLKSIAKTLADLSERLEKINAQMEQGPAPVAKKKVAPAKPAAKRAPVRKKVTEKEAAPEAMVEAAQASAAAADEGKESVLEKVFDVIKKSRNGATIANLKDKTELESRQLSNALYKLSKKGKIKAKARGVYVKA